MLLNQWKSPGSDGLPKEFYIKYFYLIGNEYVKVINNIDTDRSVTYWGNYQVTGDCDGFGVGKLQSWDTGGCDWPKVTDDCD